MTASHSFQPIRYPSRAPPSYYDGFGGQGCERITDLKKRTPFQEWRSAGLITVYGIAVFAAMVYFKGGRVNDEKK